MKPQELKKALVGPINFGMRSSVETFLLLLIL